jgi:alginate O-acetyltransferase complex protein AlgI
MLFTTLQYALFFAVVWSIHWLLPSFCRRIWLLAASYFFYMQAIPEYIWLIITCANYFLGRIIAVSDNSILKNLKITRRKLLTIAIGMNLAILAFYKYTAFLLSTLLPIIHVFPFSLDPSASQIILPLGISFFTFEFIHYQVEVYRGHAPLKSFVDFALFAAFFPTQIAGPIKRLPDWVKQLKVEVHFSDILSEKAIKLILRGMIKKIIVADTLAQVVSIGFGDPGKLGWLATWLTIYAFAIQIYCDFSGYTDIGRGCALLLGYQVPENFNNPYQSQNPGEFWRRWHISLSSWLRDYLYIPLGGSRVPRWRIHLNLLITMGLGGLWHGASWNFVIWGLFQGLLLIIDRIWQEKAKRFPVGIKTLLNGRHGILLGRILTFHLVCIGWVFFRISDPLGILHVLQNVIGLTTSSSIAGLELFTESKALTGVILSLVGCNIIGQWLWAWITNGRTYQRMGIFISLRLDILRPVLYLIMLACVVCWPSHETQVFIYFRF